MEIKRYKNRVMINLILMFIIIIVVILVSFSNIGNAIVTFDFLKSNSIKLDTIYIDGELINDVFIVNSNDTVYELPTYYKGRNIESVSGFLGENIEELIIPAETKFIGTNRLYLPNLKKITVNSENLFMVYKDNILYSTDSYYIHLINNNEISIDIKVSSKTKCINNILNNNLVVNFYLDNAIPPTTNFENTNEFYFVPKNLVGLYTKTYFGGIKTDKIKIGDFKMGKKFS